MMFQHTEAIILRVIPFQDHYQILTLFTPEAGIIKTMYHQKKNKGFGNCTPLTKIDLVYRERSGEIFGCHEIKLIDPFSSLRKELLYLDVGCHLLNAIVDSQFLGKEAPLLYALLCFYLRKIPYTQDPWILAASFQLKLLKHEGLLSAPWHCSECGQCLDMEAHTLGTESWCRAHRPDGSWLWTLDELQSVYNLTMCQNFREITTLQMDKEFIHKIQHFFEICIKK